MSSDGSPPIGLELRYVLRSCFDLVRDLLLCETREPREYCVVGDRSSCSPEPPSKMCSCASRQLSVDFRYADLLWPMGSGSADCEELARPGLAEIERTRPEPLYVKLRPGPNGHDRDAVASNQRSRLIAVMIEEVAKRGYAGTTLGETGRVGGGLQAGVPRAVRDEAGVLPRHVRCDRRQCSQAHRCGVPFGRCLAGEATRCL